MKDPKNTGLTGFREPTPLGDCASEEVHYAFEQVADYISGMPDRPLIGAWREGQISDLAKELPETGRGIEGAFEFFRDKVAPGLLRWNSPNFMAYFATSAPLPTVVAETLVTSHNSNRMLKSASPAAAELDFLAAKWYGEFLNIPQNFNGQLYYGASQSHMHALALALNRRTSGRHRREGLAAVGQQFRIYKSELAHFFVEKNSIATGIGLNNVVEISTNDVGEMIAEELFKAVEKDLQAGHTPLMVVATVGTTSVTSVDPVEAIADICEKAGLYLYIDAAYAGAFAALAEFNWLRRGWDRADAICINPHKQLMVPLGCSLLYVRDREELRQTCQHRGAYIPPTLDGEGDPMDYTFYCGMPVNSLAPIFNMLTFGAKGIRDRLRHTVDLARTFADLLEQDENFEILMPRAFSTVCFRVKPATMRSTQAINHFNTWIHETMVSRGEILISRTVVRDKVMLRLTVGNVNSSVSEVWKAYQTLRRLAEEAGSMFTFRIVCEPIAANVLEIRKVTNSLWTRIPAGLLANDDRSRDFAVTSGAGG
jgi:aromatic-L-amino-acid/L-tryptophan decarboxylase